jgi:acyl carrier protein
MDLFEAGLLDSMAFVELVIALRTATGLEVDLGAHDPESFSTIRGLLRCCGLDVEG